jgi:hypothetical protein
MTATLIWIAAAGLVLWVLSGVGKFNELRHNADETEYLVDRLTKPAPSRNMPAEHRRDTE